MAYDVNAKGFAWSSGTFTWSQLQTMLSRDSRTSVGTLLDLKFGRGVSGRVIRVSVIGSSRTAYVSGSVFKSIYNQQKASPGALKSTMFYLEPAP